ncbi:MAG: copper chaperone CopZ [Oscillospiraceae bacterium]|jgi:copper ion binding protein|nr:copper chaperone CopZ [Oscillospiraceae bacterium]
MQKTLIKVDGMSCKHCVKAVTDAVKALNGVKAVKVDLDAGTADVEYDTAAVTLESIKAAITEEGYEAAA